MLQPFLDLIRDLTKKIKAYDDTVEEIATEKYPEAAILRTVPGVGPIASITFILTIGDKDPFGTSRDVGAYLGLRPKRCQSGARDPQLRITKAGDHYLRKTLVQNVHMPELVWFIDHRYSSPVTFMVITQYAFHCRSAVLRLFRCRTKTGVG